MRMLAFGFLLLSWVAQAVELEITITPHEEYGGVRFMGSTNLPDNARFMVLLERTNYKDEDTVTVQDGRYETKLFRGKGNKSLLGEFTVTLFARFDDRWQYESLLPVLQTYRSTLITDNKLTARTTINLQGSARLPPSPPSASRPPSRAEGFGISYDWITRSLHEFNMEKSSIRWGTKNLDQTRGKKHQHDRP